MVYFQTEHSLVCKLNHCIHKDEINIRSCFSVKSSPVGLEEPVHVLSSGVLQAVSQLGTLRLVSSFLSSRIPCS